MNDKTFIYNFLDKNFTVAVGVDKPIITENYTKKTLREIEFHTLVAKILGTYLTPEGVISRQIVSNWLDEAIKKIGLRIDTFLYHCKVTLTSNGWAVIDEKDNEITFDDLLNKLEGIQTYDEISKYYDEWYQKKVFTAVDELMKTY